MGTAIGAATDWLIAQALAKVKPASPTALILDGWGPAQGTAMDSNTILAIGRQSFTEDQGNDNTQAVVVVGAGRIDEVFEIPCWLWVTRPGPNAKASRDAAVVVFDALAAAVAADRSLGGALHGGGYATIGAVTLNQHVPGENNVGITQLAGVELAFAIHCENRYTP